MEKFTLPIDQNKVLRTNTQELNSEFEFKEDLEPEFEHNEIPADILKSIQENKGDKRELNNAINKLTNGAYLDNKNLNNIIGAYGDISCGHFGFELSRTIEDNNKIWMSAGENAFLRPDALMLIFGHENPNFSILMQKMWIYYKEKYFNNNDNAVNELVNLLKNTDEQGNIFYKISNADRTFTRTDSVNTYKDFLEICKKFNLKPTGEGMSDRHIVEFLLPYIFLHKMPMDTQNDTGVVLSFPRITNAVKDQSETEKELYNEFQKDKDLGYYADYSISLQNADFFHYKKK